MPLTPGNKKINRHKQQMDERLEGVRRFFHSVMNEQKVCPACRSLIDRKQKVCPFCGEEITRTLPQQARYTTFLLAANLLLFGFMLVTFQQQREDGFDIGSLFGSLDSYTLVRFGAKYGFLIEGGEWWRFATPIFLHANLIHLAFNTWVLFDLGPAVEALYGSPKFVVLYILSGIAGFAGSFLWQPNAISIGASGALFGLIGAMVAYGYRYRRSSSDSAKNMFVRWAIYGLIYGFLIPGVDNAAHIGGLAAGVAFGSLVSDMPLLTRESIYLWRFLGVLVVLLVAFGFIMIGLRQPA
ncbi:MAG: rhomboid family intramembrane serine protease [Acidobacteria bacterium]|nr:rhomboid family intramembrane serine protease [Acidobacteriota bacterium]